MQQFNEQVENMDQPQRPARPEPFISRRVSKISLVQSPASVDNRETGTDTRSRLAEAFRTQGRGLQSEAAYEQVRHFYKATGHPWTRGLK